MTRNAMILMVALVLTSIGLSGQSLQQVYRAAVNLETVEGELDDAIALYAKVAEGSDRALAAMALLRMAGCYEALGQAQARTIYTRIVSQYSDQRTQVAEAQARLEALAPVDTDDLIALPHPTNAVDLGGGGDYDISPDGRWGLIQDYSRNGIDVGLFEYETRTVKWITDNSYFVSRADSLVMSPDGSRVAYAAGGLLAGEEVIEIHLATLSKAGDVLDRQVLLRMPPVNGPRLPNGVPDPGGFWLHGWTPNDEVIVRFPSKDGWWQYQWLDVATKRLTQIVTFPPGVVFRSPRLSPDGRFLALFRRQGEEVEIVTHAVDGSKQSVITTFTPPSLVRQAVGWSRDGSHLLFVSEQGGTKDLWAVRVEAGERVGTPFVIQRDYPTNSAPQWAGDKASYGEVGGGGTARVVTMQLDDAGTVGRLAVAPDTREGNPRWSKNGDLAYLLLDNRRLVIRHPDGSTRESLLPDGVTRLGGFNAEGTVVVADGPPPGNNSYPSDQPRYMHLYNLETGDWSTVEIPGARPGWRVDPGFTAVQGGPDDCILYYLVHGRDEEDRRNLQRFEIHRQDAEGRVTTVYASDEPLGRGPRSFWLSADGSALRFVEGLHYRELDLQTGKARNLTQIFDAGRTYPNWVVRGKNPVSSVDGRWVVFRPEPTSTGNDNSLRIVDLIAGTSRDVTLPIDAIVREQLDLTPEQRRASLVQPYLGEFRVSPAGDQIAATINVVVSGYRVLVEDPLEKFFRDTGGR